MILGLGFNDVKYDKNLCMRKRGVYIIMMRKFIEVWEVGCGVGGFGYGGIVGIGGSNCKVYKNGF